MRLPLDSLSKCAELMTAQAFGYVCGALAGNLKELFPDPVISNVVAETIASRVELVVYVRHNGLTDELQRLITCGFRVAFEAPELRVRFIGPGDCDAPLQPERMN